MLLDSIGPSLSDEIIENSDIVIIILLIILLMIIGLLLIKKGRGKNEKNSK